MADTEVAITLTQDASAITLNGTGSTEVSKTEETELPVKSSRKHKKEKAEKMAAVETQDEHETTKVVVSDSGFSDVSHVIDNIDVDVDRDYTTRLISSSGGFTSNVRENIMTHPYVLKNRTEPSSVVSHISSESRQVMRKGFDMGISSPGLRMLYDARIKELEEELEVERASRAKVDKHRVELQREVALLGEKVDETTEQVHQQVELSRRREADFQKLQRDLEESHGQNDLQQVAFRKKYQDGVNQLTEQIEQQQKLKIKVEKERNQFKAEGDELRGQIDHLTKGKISVEKMCKQLESQISDLNQRLGEMQKELHDSQGQKNRIQAENVELHRRVEETDNLLQQTNKAKITLTQQLEEMKGSLDDETLVRSKVVSENRNLQSLIEQLRQQLEEEQEARAEVQRQLTKTANESAMWKQKFESGEGSIKPEEMEEIKKKFVIRIHDMEAQLEATVGKLISLEKARSRSQTENEALMAEIEKLQAANAQNDKRQRQFDKIVEEWKKKVFDVQVELENAQKESRANASDAYKTKTQLEETHEVIEGLRRENKNLTDEIHDLTDQIAQVNHRMQEVDKVAKRFEAEREELQATLEEAEAALEQEEAKVQRAQTEVNAAKEETERRVAEKDEELENLRKNHQRAMEAMQMSIETESRNKVEALRMKKKLEQDISELEMALDGMNKTKAEVEKNIKKHQQQIRDLQQMLDDEQRLRNATREELAASERRAALLAGEIEEMRIQTELLEKNRKNFEGEMNEAADRIAELIAVNSTLTATKKKLESDIQTLHSDYEEQLNAVKVAEEHAKKAMADASRIAEELRQEQDHAGQIEKLRRSLEGQLKELQMRLDEAEAAALQGGKKMIQKLEQRVRESEVELEGEQHRHGDTQKNLRKQERRLQELTLQVDEDRKVHVKMNDVVEKLQQKINSYKKQIEEAEEIAAINLAKYRKIQHDLEESEARADMAEQMINQLRAKSRASMSVCESVSQPFAGVTVKTTTRTQNISLDSKS